MKFVCLGYADQSIFTKMDPKELERMMEECLAYDDLLRKGGHFAGGEALVDASRARTLRYSGGVLKVTDGPYAETREQIGGILILEADSMEHAVELMSGHPGVRIGPFEIRPADEETNILIAERERQFRERQSHG